MVLAFTVPSTNPNPNVGALNSDGTRVVTVLDNKNGAHRSLRVSAQEADEYVNSRQQAMKKASKRGCWTAFGLTAAGAGLGYAAAAKNIKGLAESVGKAGGAFAGALTGCALGVLAMLVNNSDKAGRKVTEDFIARNIEKENI